MCSLFDGLEFSRETKTGGKLTIKKTNVVMSGMIQPKFILPQLWGSNDYEGLFQRFFLCAPTHKWVRYHEIAELPEEIWYLPSKIWTVLMLYSIIGLENVIYTLSKEADSAFGYYYDYTTNQCEILEENIDMNIISSISKSRDHVLRVDLVLQLLDMALGFLKNNSNFSVKKLINTLSLYYQIQLRFRESMLRMPFKFWRSL